MPNTTDRRGWETATTPWVRQQLTGSPAGLTVGLSSGIAATGKTATTAHIDVRPGPDVLLVDTDPQPGARDLIDPTHPFRRSSGEGAS